MTIAEFIAKYGTQGAHLILRQASYECKRSDLAQEVRTMSEDVRSMLERYAEENRAEVDAAFASAKRVG